MGGGGGGGSDDFKPGGARVYCFSTQGYVGLCDGEDAGFDSPRGPGAYAPRFCCGPLDFSD